MKEEHKYEREFFPLRPDYRRAEPIDAIAQSEVGLRRVHHLSRWTAAALLVGVGVAAGELAHGFPPTGSSYAPVGSSSTGGGASASAPRLGHAVATSTGSTVTAGTANGTNGSGSGISPAASYQDS